MKAEGHRQAAEQIEKGIAKLQPDSDPEVARLAIEGASGASFLSRLDRETSLLVDEIIDLLAKRHPDVLALILYGSIARHEERALDEPDPSDVDILVVVDTEDKRGIRAQKESLFETLGLAKTHHLQAGREVNVLFSSRTSQEWDPTFVQNVKRDGIILYQRVPLPATFAPRPDTYNR